MAALAARVAPRRRCGCRASETDVHDLAGLAEVAAYVFAG